MQPVEPRRGQTGAQAPGGAPVERLAELGGDPACWLARVCPDCGLITEGHDADRCATCGQPLPVD